MLIVALAVLLAACFSGHVEAQAELGYIDGRVVNIPGRPPPDSHQSVEKPVAGSRVTLTNPGDGHVIATTVSDTKGEFHLAVPPGDYSISTVRDQRRIHVDAGQRTWVRLGTPGNM